MCTTDESGQELRWQQMNLAGAKVATVNTTTGPKLSNEKLSGRHQNKSFSNDINLLIVNHGS